jgi:hypothetical protein
METLTMFIIFLINATEYFVVTGFPEIPPEQTPAAVEAFFWNVVKLAEIYLSIL